MRKVRPQRDSNPQSSDSKSDALSVRLCGREVHSTLKIVCLFFRIPQNVYLELKTRGHLVDLKILTEN